MDLTKIYKILIVNDNPGEYELIASNLTENGYIPIHATNSDDAFKIYHSQRPHILIIDLHLPDDQGMELRNKIRRKESAAPIIMITEIHMLNTVTDIFLNDADDFISKPIQLKILHKKILQVIKTITITKENDKLIKLVSRHETQTKALNNKVSELSLISNYLDNCVGLTELTDVIQNLFRTVHNYLHIDIMGCLIIKKRFHDFLFWSKGRLSNDNYKQIINHTIDEYNKATKSKILPRRVKTKNISIEPMNRTSISFPLQYVQTFPLSWERYNFCTLYFGAANKPDKKTTFLPRLINQTHIALINAKLYSDMKENYIRTIKALAIAVDAKDTYTHGHSEKVMKIAEEIAIEMNMDAKSIETIRDGGLLHDIGKIGIPGYILNKPGPLTYEEFNGVMKTHSTLGANIVKDVPFLKELYSLILYHHEHFDGTGYPDGLCADSIPLGARIIHVADAFEAMSSNRPYSERLSKNAALVKLQERKGKEFDPDVVNALVKIVTKKK